MTKHPLLLFGACGLVVLSLAWATVFAVTVQAPSPTQTIAIVPIELEPSQVASSSGASPLASVWSPGVTPASSGAPTPTLLPPGVSSTQNPIPLPTVLTTPVVTPEPVPFPTPSPPLPVPSPTPAATPEPTPVPTQPPTDPPLPEIALTCANGVDNGGGTGTICEITITSVGATVLECHGAAGDPRAACSTTTYSGRVTSVTACDGTANGGGAVLRCSVTGVGSGSASVSMCVGSGGGGTLVELTCTWSGSSGVTVSLCNGSGNGGGALIVCRVD